MPKRRANMRFLAAGILFLIAVALFAWRPALHSTLGYILLLSSFPIASLAVRVLASGTSWARGSNGESQVLTALRNLPDNYTAVSNWKLPDTKNGDVDLLILGPHGVLVIEVKNFGAQYECDNDVWVNIKPNGYRVRIKSPSLQIKRNTKAVKSHLRQFGWSGPVQGVLVMRPRSNIRILASSVDIIDWSSIEAYINRLPTSNNIPLTSWFKPDRG